MKQVKLKSMTQREKEEALNEIRLLASVNHPNVVRFHEAFIEDDVLHIVRGRRCVISAASAQRTDGLCGRR